ncbi:hypothetical protein HD554DRAFT_2219560 [Boletus coccyginus]|nr:hypothetical protein HD554DRAFT_2219560 [Boletus coccyginus]
MASLHFCSECNNLLYPKADPQRRIMVYACRICDHFEIGDNKCVYRNDLLTVTKEQVGVTTDLGLDPTLARHFSAHSNISCPRCGHEECVIRFSIAILCCSPVRCSAVFYQDQSKRKETRMILFFVCVKCNHSFTDPSLPPESQPDTR